MDKRHDEKKRWRLSHPQSVRRSNRKQYYKNRAARLAYCKDYRRKNEARIAAWMKIYAAKRYRENREKILAQTAAYAKSHPEVRRRCALNYRANHPERVRIQRSACAHRRKARLKNCQVGDAGVSRLIASWKKEKTFTCSYCRLEFPINKLHVDHIRPLSKGGSHTKENICKACGPCNIRKRDR
jgi:5-methylcytosine-specific restriction endonuclease McrA